MLFRNIPAPELEFKFHPTRRWRFDYAWPDQKVAVEVEGGVWIGGRHTSGSGFVKDMEKYNFATAMGWKIFRFTPQQLRNSEHIKFIEFFLKEVK